MLATLTTALLGSLALAPAAQQQSAPEILETMRARQLERWETVDNYTVYSRFEGFEVPAMREAGLDEVAEHYQKHVIDGEVAFGLVPPAQYQLAAAQEGEDFVTPGFFELYGDDAKSAELDAQMAKSGFPAAADDDYPGAAMSDGALFSDAAGAVAKGGALGFGRRNAARSLQGRAEMERTMKLVGREEIDGRDAFHLRAEGLNRVLGEAAEGQQFVVRTVDMWVDAERYVELRLAVHGEVEADGRRQDVTIEKSLQDYREVGPLYESYRQVMKMSGMMAMMSDEDREKLEEAQEQMAKLDEMEAQLEQMPAAARGMVERQIAKARSQMEMLTGDGDIELVTEVLRIDINKGPRPLGDDGH